MSGDVLLSHKLPLAVPSALKGLTSGFGMEPGVSLSLWPPKLYGVGPNSFVDETVEEPDRDSGATQWTRNIKVVRQALGLLVPVGSVYCYLRPPAYQPSRLLGALPGCPGGKPHLETCFPLRCFQRLSLPNVANQ